jgi:hypothetical protein
VALKFVKYDSPQVFLAAAESFLLQREVENCLILGLSGSLVSGGLVAPPGSDTPGFYAVTNDGDVRVAAMRTPPYKLLITRAAGSELECLIQRIHAADPDIPGVGADRPTVKPFADQWCELTGKSARLGVQMRIHELTEVTPPKLPPGKLRLASASEFDLLYEWMRGFAEDAGTSTVRAPEDWIPAAVEEEQVYLWDDDGPVSMAIWGRATDNGVSIRGVYTPRDLRNRGYASAVVAGVSQLWLDRGKRFACLFTDLTNPTSSHIYYEVGYRPVVDVDDYLFD